MALLVILSGLALGILSGLALGANCASVALVFNLTFVEIAQSMTHAPSFILLDEPRSGLTHVQLDHQVRVTDELRAQGLAAGRASHRPGMRSERLGDNLELRQDHLHRESCGDPVEPQCTPGLSAFMT
jgi:hypothetical protein